MKTLKNILIVGLLIFFGSSIAQQTQQKIEMKIPPILNISLIFNYFEVKYAYFSLNFQFRRI